MKIKMENLSGQKSGELILSAISPAPLALISTINADGIKNAALVSMIAPVSWKPPVVCISIGLREGEKKDTFRNIEFSHDFVVNIMDDNYIQQTVQTSVDYPADVDEIETAGLTATRADRVKSPLIAEAQISMECKVIQSLEFGEGKNLRTVYFGEVVVSHIKDDLWVGDSIDPHGLRALGCIIAGVYCRTRDIVEVKPSEI